MTLKPLTVRITKELEQEISQVVEDSKLDRATVVRSLIELGLSEWRKRNALELLRTGKVTFAAAAEIAKLSLWDFADLVKQHNIEWVKLTSNDIEREFEDASAE